MARSYKKNPIVKYGSSYHKKLSNKRVRRKVKSMLQISTYDEDCILPIRDELTDGWSVVDRVCNPLKDASYSKELKKWFVDFYGKKVESNIKRIIWVNNKPRLVK